MKVLIVDDDAVSRAILRRILAAGGHSVVEKEDGVAALRTLEDEKVDAIISDILMPRMDGYRLCYEIRKRPALNSIPFIAYTSTYTSGADVQAALDIGADHFLEKTAGPELILKALDEAQQTRTTRARQSRKPDELFVMREYSEALVRKLEKTNLELSQANQTLEERATLAEFGAEVARTLTLKATLGEILQRCVETVIRPIDGASAGIWTLSSTQPVLDLQAACGALRDKDECFDRVPLGCSEIGRIASERKPCISHRIAADPRIQHQAWAQRENLVAFAGYPLIVDDALLGVMAIFTAKPLSPNALPALSSVADGIALGIERKKAEEEIHARYRELQTLQEISQTVPNSLDLSQILDSILERTIALGGFDTGVICLLDPATECLTTAAIKGYRDVQNAPRPRRPVSEARKTGIIIRALIKNEIQAEENILAGEGWHGAKREGLQAAISVPVLAGEKILGVLHLGCRAPRKFFPEETRLLKVIGSQLGIAVQKALLHKETKQSLNRTRALLESALDCIVTMDHEGKVIEFNPAAEKTFNYRRADVIGKELCDLIIPPALRERHRRGLANFLRTGEGNVLGKRLDITAMRAGGTEFPAELIVTMASPDGPPTFTGFIRDISERKRAEEQVQRNLDRLRALHEIDLAINSSLDLPAILRVLLEKIELFIPYPSATTVRLLNKETGHLVCLAVRNIDAAEWIGVVPGRLARPILQNKRPLVLRNVQTAPGLSDPTLYRKYGLVSYIGVPLIVKDEAIGVLNLYTKEEHDFSDEEKEFLTTLAGQAAVAIYNAQLFEGIGQAKKELETTNLSLEKSLQQLGGLHTALAPVAAAGSIEELMAGIIDRLIEATGADAALIRAWDERAGVYPIIAQRGFSDAFQQRAGRAPGGAVQWVITHGEPIVAPNIAADARLKGKLQLELGLQSCAMLPLKVHGRVRGMIQLSSRTLGYFEEEQTEHLAAIARQMSIAWENRELFDEVRASRDALKRANAALLESNRMLSALHTVAATASQTLELDQVLQAAIQRISEILGFDATQIHLYNEATEDLRLRAALEKESGHFTSATCFKKGRGIIGTVAETGKPLIFEDVQTDPRYRQLSATKVTGRFGYHFFAVFPIVSKLRNLGTLACTNTAPRKLSAGELQLLESLTDQVAVAIENSELYERVTQKVQELQQKTAELEQANKIKGEFLSVISHELRTPLNIILGYTGLLHEQVFGAVPQEQQDILRKIEFESMELLMMIDSVLNATSLEAGQPWILRDEVSLGMFIEEIKANCRVPVAKQLDLIWDCAAAPETITTDGKKLRHILDNLIHNAIKFTQEGSVTIAVRACDEGAPAVEFKVSDTGVGIATEAVPYIFSKFRQADGSQTREYGGMGLGLYIVKSFTDLLGGTVEVETAPAKGSTFTIRLPLEPPQDVAEKAAGASQDRRTDNPPLELKCQQFSATSGGPLLRPQKS